MRIRTVKPDFFLDQELAQQLAPLVRILFLGLWCQADREGRLEDWPRRIKAQALPYDDLDCDQALGQLHEAGYIIRYEVGGKKYIQVRTFEKNQRPNSREPKSVIPSPPTVQEPRVHARARTRKHAHAHAPHMHAQEEGKGMERNGISSPSENGAKAPDQNVVQDHSPGTEQRRSDWSTAAAKTYLVHYPKAQVPKPMFKVLGPLARANPWPEVEAELDAYLRNTEVAFHNWSKFAAGFGQWADPKALAQARASPRRFPSRSERNQEIAMEILRKEAEREAGAAETVTVVAIGSGQGSGGDL